MCNTLLGRAHLPAEGRRLRLAAGSPLRAYPDRGSTALCTALLQMQGAAGQRGGGIVHLGGARCGGRWIERAASAGLR